METSYVMEVDGAYQITSSRVSLDSVVYDFLSGLGYAGISSRSSAGSSPNHCGFPAVLSKIDDVLNGSKRPFAAASLVLPSNALRSSSLSG